MAEDSNTQAAEWLQPPVEKQGLTRYVETIRERLWLIVLAVVVSVGVAIAYVGTAPKVYEAEADLLVTPASRDDPALAGLGLIQESSDPTRDTETAARLVTTIDVADRARQILNSDQPPRELLSKVTAEPVAQSNIVAIRAKENSPEGARDLANAVGEAVVEDRTEILHSQIDRILPRLRERSSGRPQPGELDPIASQIATLETLRSSDDPTIRVETQADAPSTPVSPRPVLSIVAGLLAGLVLGVAAAFGFQVLDPKLRREAQLRSLYRLPILTRVPKEGTRGGDHDPLAPDRLSGQAIEAYRTLRATMAASREDIEGSRAILVTSSSPSEGKTTTAVNLASSLALAGNRVILIEADLRRPSIGKAFGVQANYGVVSVLIENVSLADALVTPGTYGSNLQLLLADYAGGWIAELFSLPAGQRLVTEAKRYADYVIVDSPPLTEVIDALPLAKRVDDVVIVVRLGRTSLGKISQLGELLAGNGIKPTGFAVVGAPRSGGGYYYYAEPPGEAGNGDRSLFAEQESPEQEFRE